MISVRAFYEEQLAREPVTFVPKKYDFSGVEQRRQGEEAEKMVLDMIKKAGNDIPGIKMVCFQGVYETYVFCNSTLYSPMAP